MIYLETKKWSYIGKFFALPLSIFVGKTASVVGYGTEVKKHSSKKETLFYGTGNLTKSMEL